MSLIVFHEKFFVLHAEDDGVGLDQASFHDMGDDMVFRGGTVLADIAGDHFLDRARLKAPLGKSVYAATNENKALVFDKLVVHRLHMRIASAEVRFIDHGS